MDLLRAEIKQSFATACNPDLCRNLDLGFHYERRKQGFVSANK
jgi:hypothetical protein